MKSELERLKEQVRAIENKQAFCTHEWEDIEFEPENREIVRTELAFHGTPAPDHWYTRYISTGRYETVDRWSRTCKKCSKKEYTYQQEIVPVKTIKKPKF